MKHNIVNPKNMERYKIGILGSVTHYSENEWRLNGSEDIFVLDIYVNNHDQRCSGRAIILENRLDDFFSVLKTAFIIYEQIKKCGTTNYASAYACLKTPKCEILIGNDGVCCSTQIDGLQNRHFSSKKIDNKEKLQEIIDDWKNIRKVIIQRNCKRYL